MTEALPEDARNLIQTIDIQLESIIVHEDFTNDETEALLQQRAALEEWKREILAQPDTASIKTSKREALDDEIDADAAAKRVKWTPETECCSCLQTFRNRLTVKLKCCETRYCKECFQQWFDAALTTRQLPKCCEIGIEPTEYSRDLNADIKRRYKVVAAEIDAEKKLWCSNAACRVFIKVGPVPATC